MSNSYILSKKWVILLQTFKFNETYFQEIYGSQLSFVCAECRGGHDSDSENQIAI